MPGTVPLVIFFGKIKSLFTGGVEMSKKSLQAVLMIICLMIAVPVLAEAYDHEVTARGMSFAWTVDGETLKGKMSAKTGGWVAVGFNPSDKMKDANIIIGYVKDGVGTVADHFGDQATGHADDTELGGTSDVTLVGASEENGMTTIEFTMPMASADANDGALTADGDTVLLMAYGPDRDSFKPRHSYRGTKTVNLATGAEK
jgi:hypothetical protein